MKTIIIIFLCLVSVPACAKHLNPESYYQDLWCSAHNGQAEITLNNGLRADCITDKEAIEFDFAIKYRESIIQALEYAEATGKQAKTVLIVEKESDNKYVDRANQVIKFYNLPVSVEIYGDLNAKNN